MKFIVDGVVLTIIGTFGVIGNLGAVLHFGNTKRRQQRFYGLMLALAITDLLVITSFMWFYSIPEFLSTTRQSHYWSIWLLPLLHIFCTNNICVTIMISIERYLAICRPLFYHAYNWPLRYVLLPIVFVSTIYNIPKFFELKWLKIDIPVNGTVVEIEYGAVPTDLRINQDYVTFYILLCDVIFHGALPVSLLIIFNILVLKEMQNYRNYTNDHKKEDILRQNQIQMVNINIIIVAVFILCHSVRHVPTIGAMWYRTSGGYLVPEYPNKNIMWIITEMSQVMVVFNSSINFYVYLLKYRFMKRT